jgi:hypothetical protein
MVSRAARSRPGGAAASVLAADKPEVSKTILDVFPGLLAEERLRSATDVGVLHCVEAGTTSSSAIPKDGRLHAVAYFGGGRTGEPNIGNPSSVGELYRLVKQRYEAHVPTRLSLPLRITLGIVRLQLLWRRRDR